MFHATFCAIYATTQLPALSMHLPLLEGGAADAHGRDDVFLAAAKAVDAGSKEQPGTTHASGSPSNMDPVALHA